MQVLLVEDDPDVRDGMAAALRAAHGLEVRTCASVSLAMRALDELAALDVALVDLGLPDGSGKQVIRRVRSRYPAAIVLVVTIFGDDETIVSSLAAGAHGYLLKGVGGEELVAQVMHALHDGVVLSPVVARRVVQSFWPAQQPEEGSAVRLGRREVELLEQLNAGRTYQEAALSMDLQLGTVQGYVKRVYRKLGARSRIEALRIAVRQGHLRP